MGIGRRSLILLVLPAVASCGLPSAAPPATRLPDASTTAAPTQIQAPQATSTEALAAEPSRGSLSGRVDMSAAPPYLNDPIVTGGLGVPVVVVAFNLDDGTYSWVDTTPTHPDFSLGLPAGRYHVVAYGEGVADVPYVTGGYTGENPSCGRDLVEVRVEVGEETAGIEIADWNWVCRGTAARPEKPDDVPIP